MQNVTLLLERYKRIHDKAVMAYEKGDLKNSRTNFLHAAEVMFEIANKSPEKLKKIRLEKAKALIQLAENQFSRKKNTVNNFSNKNKHNVDKLESKFKPQDSRNDLYFKDIIGYADAKEYVITQMILPMNHSEAFEIYNKRSGGGMMLYGPPGTGKTTFAKAVANEAKASFFYIKSSDILDKYVGESEKNIANLFKSMANEERSVLFIDEMDALFMSKDKLDSNSNSSKINEFLEQMSGFSSKNQNRLLLGATNRPWDIDPAITRPGRFDRPFYIGLPNKQDRIEMLKKFLDNVPVENTLDYSKIADQTEFFSGADLRELCEQSKYFPLMNFIKENEDSLEKKIILISNDDFDKALEKVSPSVRKEQLDKFEGYRFKKTKKKILI
jgi:transitional endoplasmic reticulum ATPase